MNLPSSVIKRDWPIPQRSMIKSQRTKPPWRPPGISQPAMFDDRRVMGIQFLPIELSFDQSHSTRVSGWQATSL